MHNDAVSSVSGFLTSFFPSFLLFSYNFFVETFKTNKERKIMLSRVFTLAPAPSIRQISYSYPLWKKSRGKQAKNDASEDNEEVVVIDVKKYIEQATDGFRTTLELHKKKLNEARLGTANPQIFNGLKIGKEGHKFTDLATTSLRGRNSLLVTVFDPKDTKNIISGIMAAGLNLNPEKIPNNEQQLKVSLPPPTTESRKQMCKELKKVFEEFKNSSSKNSLGHIRGEVMKELKKIDKKNDSVSKIIQDVEKLHKEYTTKLQDQLKQAEKSVMG